VERSPAFILGVALIEQPEFWRHVAAIRDGSATAFELARKYIRRDQGHRRRLIAEYLTRAAEASSDGVAKARVLNIGLKFFTVDGDPADSAPTYSLRPDAADTLWRGAIRIARRGADRCISPDCGRPPNGGFSEFCPPVGAKLAAGRKDGLCQRCRRLEAQAKAKRGQPKTETGLEAERRLFDAAIPQVFPGVPSRPTHRRKHRREKRRREARARSQPAPPPKPD
jgi:hypothetical protein